MIIKKLIQVKIHIFDYDYVNAILNNDVCNLINRIFVRKFNLIFYDVDQINVIIINKKRIITYDVYFSRFDVKNRFNYQRFFDESFLKTNIHNDMILNMS